MPFTPDELHELPDIFSAPNRPALISADRRADFDRPCVADLWVG